MTTATPTLPLFTLTALTTLALLGCPSTAPDPGAAAKGDAAKGDATKDGAVAAPAADGTTPAADATAPAADATAPAADGTKASLDRAAADSKKTAAKTKFESQDQATIRTNKSKMVSALNEGRSLVKQDKLDEGIAKYEALLVIDPHYGPALGELGWAEFKAGRLDAAQAHTQQALARAPDDKRRGMFHYNLGRIAEERGQTDAAIEAYALSLSFRPNETVASRLALISHVEDAAGTAFEHPAVEDYRSKHGEAAKPAPGALDVLGANFASSKDACEAARTDCAANEDEACDFQQGTDDSWGVLVFDDNPIMSCWHPLVKLGNSWTLFTAALVGQWGSEIDQGVDAISMRVVDNAAGSFLIIDFSAHIYDRDWAWGELEDDEEIPEGNWKDSEGQIICTRGATVVCTDPIASKYSENGIAYQASITLDGDVVVIGDVSTTGAVEFGVRDNIWDLAEPLPAGRYPLAELL
jgi:tetratricopeptide (TPR) repeat protein